MDALDKDQYKLRAIIKKNMIPLTIMLSFGFLFNACTEMQNPVSESTVTESFSLPAASTIGVNEDPVTIQDFTIEFKGNSYDEVANTSTFSYELTRNSEASGFNYLFFETPTCANYVSSSPSATQTVVEDTQGIKWTSSIGKGQSQDISVTYSGNQPTGMVDAIIQGTGSGDIETEPIPGPCKGIYTISGFIYVDENGNGTKDAGEGGIGNVLVHLLDDNSSEFTDPDTSSSNGSYAFNVFTGSTSTDFNIDVSYDLLSDDFSENFSPTTDLPLTVTVNNADVSNQNVGFKPETEKIIQKFEAGDEIVLKTEKPKFWADEYKFSEKGKKTVFSTDELLEFLDAIDNLEDLAYSFQFGTNDSDRISNAEKILSVRGNSTDLEILLSEFLAALLNVVSGHGAFDENGNVLEDFNTLILKIGAAAAVTESGNNNSLMMNSTTLETTTFTGTAYSTSGDLLTSFNGGGGGVGN